MRPLIDVTHTSLEIRTQTKVQCNTLKHVLYSVRILYIQMQSVPRSKHSPSLL